MEKQKEIMMEKKKGVEEKKVKDLNKELTENERKKIELHQEKLLDQKDNIELNKENVEKLIAKNKEAKEAIENNKSIQAQVNVDNKLKKAEEKFSAISTYNGDTCDDYNWSQGTTDVQIQLKLPKNTGPKKVCYFI